MSGRRIAETSLVGSPRDLVGNGRRVEPDILARAGALEVRLATSQKEICRAQNLRYEIFFEGGGADPDEFARLTRRDVCRFDEVCDHLIVVDNSALPREEAPTVVGAYRLLRQSVADRHFGFYSAREFDVNALIARHPGKHFLELGRSCVAADYRGKRALDLLWRGISLYALQNGIDVLFGCASLEGVDPYAHADTLSFLRGAGPPDPVWSVDAASGAIAAAPPTPAARIDAHVAERALPPLVKGYWRLGARFSRELVVDPAFGTVDVFVVLPVGDISSRYLARFGPSARAAPIAA